MNTIDNVECAQQGRLTFSGTLPGVAEMRRDRGIQRAVSHADMITDRWSEQAYGFLKRYLQNNPVFMTEQVREASKGIVPEPPSGRAWGAIVVRAVKEGLIRRIGFQTVKNVKAHCTPATLWQVK